MNIKLGRLLLASLFVIQTVHLISADKAKKLEEFGARCAQATASASLIQAAQARDKQPKLLDVGLCDRKNETVEIVMRDGRKVSFAKLAGRVNGFKDTY